MTFRFFLDREVNATYVNSTSTTANSGKNNGQFESLKDGITGGLKDAVLNVAKMMGVNASEELLTEVANIIYDTAANGGLSEYETSIRAKMAQGMSEEDARKAAATEFGLRVVESGLSGAFMGFGFGTAGSAKSYYTTSTSGKAIQTQGITQYALKGHKGKGVAKRNSSWYSQFESEVMSWANKAERRTGDMCMMPDMRKGATRNTFCLFEADGQGGYVELKVGKYKVVKDLYDYYESKKANGPSYSISNDSRSMRWDNSIGRNGRMYGGYDSSTGTNPGSRLDTTANNEHLRSDHQEAYVSPQKYSLPTQSQAEHDDSSSPTVAELTEAFTNGAKRAGYVPSQTESTTASPNNKTDAPVTSSKTSATEPIANAENASTTATESTVAELTEAFKAGVEGRKYAPNEISQSMEKYVSLVGDRTDESDTTSKQIQVFRKKVSSGEAKTIISRQKQSRHIRGTREFEVYATKLLAKGDFPSYLREDIALEDLFQLIKKKLGTGVIELRHDGSFQEYIDCDDVIGYYYDKKKGKYMPTKRVQVKYAVGNGNIHIIPVREDGRRK